MKYVITATALACVLGIAAPMIVGAVQTQREHDARLETYRINRELVRRDLCKPYFQWSDEMHDRVQGLDDYCEGAR